MSLRSFTQKKRLTTSPGGKQQTAAHAVLKSAVNTAKPTTKEIIDIEDDAPEEVEELITLTPPPKPVPVASPSHRTSATATAAANNKRKAVSNKPSTLQVTTATTTGSSGASIATPPSASAVAAGRARRSSPALKKLKLSPQLTPATPPAPTSKVAEPEIDASAPIDLPENPREGVLPRYWEGVSDAEVLLRKFDLDVRYGPAMGVTRKERWIRANGHGLNPPLYVWQLLTQSAAAATTKSKRTKGGGAAAVNQTVEQTSLWDRSLI